MKFYKVVTIILLGAIPVSSFSNELTNDEVVSASNVIKQYYRHKLSLRNCADSLQYVYGNNEKTTTVKFLKDVYSRQLELAASYHLVLHDQSRNIEIKKLSQSLYDLELMEAKVAKELENPSAAEYIINFFQESIATSFNEKNSVQSEKIREQQLKNNFQEYIKKAENFTSSLQEVFKLDNDGQKKISIFLKLHREIPDIEILNTQNNEHNSCAAEGIKILKSSSVQFFRTLIGESLGKNQNHIAWRFEESDKLLSLEIIDQKTFGNCIVSNVSLTVCGLNEHQNKMIFKVAHLVTDDYSLKVIGLN